MNIFKKIASDNQIFKNENVFLPEYLPEELLHRETELREIVFAVKSLEEQRKPPSILIYGPPGTGKTCTAKYIVKEFSEYSQRAKPTYVNCWQNNTRYAIIAKVAQAMNALVPTTGVSVDDIIVRAKEAYEEHRRVPLVILDEVDILQKKNEEDVLYDLLRMNEIYGIPVGLIMITNDVSFLSKLDRRIRSSLAQNAVEFASYGPQQIKDILRERAKMGIFPGAYNEEIIGACAGFSAKNNGDARIGIALLWMAGKNAEKKGKNKIELEDIETAKSKVEVGLSESKQEVRLSPEDKKILDMIKKAGEITSGDLYGKLEMNDRTIRNHLVALEAGGFIESEERNSKNGRTRIFRMKKEKE